MSDHLLQPQDLERIGFQVSPAPQVITSNRRILEVNQAFGSLFGFERMELIGELLLKLYPSQTDFRDIGERSLNWLRHAKNGAYSDERFMQHRNGEVFWARASGFTLTPEDPFQLMVWHFERVDRAIRTAVNLTPREREISVDIVNGLTCKEIGRRLNISHRTVEVHRARLMKKLKAKNSAELVSKIIVLD
ncbi:MULTISPECIES: LuxR C-terminal-related transcriptional regulator [Pseudomonas]|jgi:PAS domain S-box-containing protein|uniref:LuxR C-terminal-related transcriptional regulator n=1 Tax=Pseudomonas TaxID=286 RepID=UPI000E6AA05D|nr:MULTISPECIES: LuxR C-terminal-related transcriptional regulator [Pseudomonas]MBG6128497.1 PAS domain S-box-containing protein [Pseudomonas sp. M2]NSX19559.1 PAS domain S-box protein [Pseudomonas putida]UTL83349.1 LuxR C-terminal-related transcriptional regulator [Pseudomonas putida]HDS1748528.1 PAS domain S-box protein [Pseudomonas putida]